MLWNELHKLNWIEELLLPVVATQSELMDMQVSEHPSNLINKFQIISNKFQIALNWNYYVLLNVHIATAPGIFEAASLDVKKAYKHSKRSHPIHIPEALKGICGASTQMLVITSKYMQPKILLTKIKIHKSLILFNF